MIAGTIPKYKELFARIKALTPFQVSHGIFAVTSVKGVKMKLMGQQIDRPIVGLPLPFIGDVDRNLLITWPPHFPTHIPPQQVALVFQQDDQLTIFDFGTMRLQFFLITSRRSCTCVSWRFGLAFSL